MRFVRRSDTDIETLVAVSKLKQQKKYNIDAVKNSLRKIYHGCCAYCEGKVEPVAYFEIEHFYPKDKDKYPQWRLDFHNLHYACPRCNRLKGKKVKKILSPNYYNNDGIWEMYPKEIDSCMCYVGHKLVVYPNAEPLLQQKGEETVKLFQLNDRPSLVMARLRRYTEVYNLLEIIREVLAEMNNINPKKMEGVMSKLFQQLISYTEPGSAYATMIIQNFGTEIYKLLQIWQKYKTLENPIHVQNT